MNRQNCHIFLQWILIISVVASIGLSPLWIQKPVEETKTQNRQEQTWLFDESIIGKYTETEQAQPVTAMQELTPEEKLQTLKTKAAALHTAQSNEGYQALTLLINPSFPLPQNYVPEDMVALSRRAYEGARMRKEAADALERLMVDSEAQGHVLYVISAYRSYDLQERLYNVYIESMGREAAENQSAPPGASEHQSGLAVDLSCDAVGLNLVETFESTPEGMWVAENAWRYGFIIRYPKDKSHITGYVYEPWHLRYIGEEMAAIIYETGLTMEELYEVQSP